MNHTERSAEQIQADIQRTRRDLDQTLTQLERRLEPRRLVDQGIDYVRDHGAVEYLSNLGKAAKDQPLPLALVGVGLAWMMMTNGRSASGRADGPSLGEGIHEAAAEAGSRIREGVGSLHSRASELGGAVNQVMSETRGAAQRTSQSLSEAADATMARAAQVGDATRRGAQKVRSGYDHLVNEQPLALGAIGLALGAVLAAAAPRTRQEDEWMGDSSDRLVDGAMRAGRGKIREVQRAATEALDPSQREAAEPSDAALTSEKPPGQRRPLGSQDDETSDRQAKETGSWTGTSPERKERGRTEQSPPTDVPRAG